MAKDDRGRIRVFFAEFEGTAETLQESVRALTGAVQRTFEKPQPQVKVLHVSGEVDAENLLETDGETDSAVVDAALTEAAASDRKGSKPNAKRVSPTYKLLGDLDLRPEGAQSLRDFYAERKRSSDQERIAIFIYWMQHIGKVDKIGLNHLYTCYNEMRLKSPTNIGQVVTNTKNRTGYVQGSKDSLTVSVKGENFVKHDSLNKHSDE